MSIVYRSVKGSKLTSDEVDGNFQYLEGLVGGQGNAIITETGFSLVGQDLTINAGWQWKILNQSYSNASAVVLNIPLAASGNQRIDIVVANQSGGFERVSGIESASNPTAPVVPTNKLVVTFLNVSDGEISDPDTPILGSQFKQKNESQKFTQVLGGTNAVIDLQTYGQQYYVVIGPVTSIAGFSKALITATPTAEVPYGGKDFYFENKTDHDVTLKNAFSGVDIPFNLGADLVVPTKGIVWLKYNPATEKMNLFFKSWTQIDISGKLDKSSTPSSVYATDAAGLQVMKPISEFQTPVGDYVTVNTAQTITGKKTFNNVNRIKKINTSVYNTQSGGSFFIGQSTSGYDIIEFYSLDGLDQNSSGSVQIYSNPEEGNFICHNSLDNQHASYLNVKNFDLSLVNLYAGQRTALYVDGQTDKITIEGTQNKFAALGTSLITGTKNFEFPNNSGTLALLSDLTDTQNALNLKLSIESPSTTGTVISFTNDKVYGTLTTPETGNITADVTNAKLGVTNIIIHNSVTAPTFDSKFKKLSGSGNYATGVVNYIYCTYISATEIIYSINQRA